MSEEEVVLSAPLRARLEAVVLDVMAALIVAFAAVTVAVSVEAEAEVCLAGAASLAATPEERVLSDRLRRGAAKLFMLTRVRTTSAKTGR